MIAATKPSVLFVCVHNAGRSQMAAGFLRHLAGASVEVRSAGSAPADQINPVAVQAMDELGIDITDQKPTILTPDDSAASSVVITMGCGDVCPYFPGQTHLDWELDDPAGQSLEAVRRIRDDIRARVETLLAEILPYPPYVLPARRENSLRAAGIGCLVDRPPTTGENMTPLPTPTLHTARLRLRPFDDADANDLFALHSSAYVLRYWDAPPWSERVRAERFITACRQLAGEGTGARLAVDRDSDGAFIGWCSLTRWNPDYRSASLGYCFNDAAWGHGYATEAARALLRWAFDTLDLNRVQAETDTRNVASARVLEKLGFVREGTLREDCVVNGEVSDSWVYGLIRRQWRPSSEPVATP